MDVFSGYDFFVVGLELTSYWREIEATTKQSQIDQIRANIDGVDKYSRSQIERALLRKEKELRKEAKFQMQWKQKKGAAS